MSIYLHAPADGGMRWGELLRTVPTLQSAELLPA